MNVYLNFDFTGDPVFDSHISSVAIIARNIVKTSLNEIPDRSDEAAIVTINAEDFIISYIGNNHKLKLKIDELNEAYREKDVWGLVLKQAANQGLG